MDNNKLQDLLKQIEGFSLSEIMTLQLAQKKMTEQRTFDFLKAIETSDLNKIKELITLEINFTDPELWRQLGRSTDLSKASVETIDYLMNLSLSTNSISSDLINNKSCNFDLTEPLEKGIQINPMDAFKKVAKEKIADMFHIAHLRKKIL